MYLKYGLSGLIIGFILGILIMQFKTRNLHQKNISQENTLKYNTKKFNEHQQELNNFFNQNIHLLDIIAKNYQTLYQHVLKNSKIFLTHDNDTHDINPNVFQNAHYNITNTNQFLEKTPRDYPEK